MSLPNWKGASELYSVAYRILERMARDGHGTAPRIHKRTLRVLRQGSTSTEMDTLIKALNKGDEEEVKGLLLSYPYDRYRFLKAAQ